MKGPAVIAKNLKLLFRSRETAFTIIFGPLLIILLVSAAYTGGSEDKALLVGVYAPDYTPLVDEMFTALQDKGYLVSNYGSKEDCTELIKTSEIHTCVIFPEDFELKDNETKEVTFAVDYSRINLVYEIIEGLSAEFAVQSTELSEDLASDVLQRVALAQKEISTQLQAGAEIEQRMSDVQENAMEGRKRLGSVNVNVSFTDLKEIRGRVTGLSGIITEVKTIGIDAIDKAEETLREVKGETENETRELIDEVLDDLLNKSDTIRQVSDDAPRAVEEVSRLIDEAALAISKAKESHIKLVNASADVEKRLTDADKELGESLKALTTLRGKLGHIDSSLRNVLGLEASSVASPITTKIEAVNTEEDNLAFTYPYVLMLVIMFLGFMLNSSLIVMDKISTAAFRNFTTATRDEYHILYSFFTTFLILLAQILVILLVSFLFVTVPLFSNFAVSLVIIIIAITLFSFLGMLVGYLTGTQEAAMIASLSIGSVLLFVSNLVLPLEAMNAVVKVLSSYNPYVVLSELLKQSMLFDLKLIDIPGKMSLLLVAIVILFMFVIAIQRSVKAKFFKRRSKDLKKTAFTPRMKPVKPLVIGDREVQDLFDLLEALDSMTRSEFEEIRKGGKNPISAWVRIEIGDKSLSRKLKTPSKERMILTLDKYLKKLTKKLQKEQ
ncbi:ABC transporter permease [Candidatus Woesearchaeota archaeon]|nr:ABC transporter permease [Candidatus Woesearchaeota archaeon]